MNLDKFSNLLKTQEAEINNSISFLEVINKYYDENIISRYLLYIFINNTEFLNMVLRSIYKDNFKDINNIIFYKTEFVISENKRIDILIKCRDIDNYKVLLVIENKINTTEHDNQCQIYFDYCNKLYKDYKQYYLLIYPDYNWKINEISDSNFRKITYSNLLQKLKSIDNKTLYEYDFIKLISNKLRSRPMDELKEFFIDNYIQIQETLNSLNKELDSIFDELKDHFLMINSNEVLADLTDNHRTLRFYKNNDKWRNGWEVNNEERVYFYVELKCEGNLDFYIQRTLKIYSNDLNNPINRYLLSTDINLIEHPYNSSFKVFERIKIDVNSKKLTNVWKQEFIDKVEKELKLLFICQQEEVDKYYNFKENLESQ